MNISKTVLLTLFALFLVSPAFAGKGDGKCEADIKSYCANETPGNNHVMDCLFRNKDKISSTCKEVVVAFRQNVHEKREECRPDADKLCQGIKHGEGRIQKCLYEHLSELSATCKTNVEKAHAMGK